MLKLLTLKKRFIKKSILSDKLTMKKLYYFQRILVLFLISFLSTNFVYAKQNKITAKDFTKASFNKMQRIRFAYIEFLKKVEQAQQFGNYQGEKFSFFYKYQNNIKSFTKMYSAYAADGDVCFFGGWPSIEKSQICEAPWKHTTNAKVLSYGDVYSESNACGSPSQFRCNPVLFGTPNENVSANEKGISINLNPSNGKDKGYCIETSGTYVELTQKCVDASHKSVEKLISDYQAQNDEGKKKREQLVKFHDSIFGADGKSGFCARFRTQKGEIYDACDDLKRRLQELGLPLEGEQTLSTNVPEEEVVAPVNTSTQPVSTEQIAVPAPIKSNQNLNRGLSVLNACQDYLNESSADDIKGRAIIQRLHGGLASCLPGHTLEDIAPLTDSSLEEVNDNFDKINYLSELNLENFKTIISALISAEISYLYKDGEFPQESLPLDDPKKLKDKIKESFPNITEQRYSQAFDEVYSQIITRKNQIPKQRYEDVMQPFEALADNNSDSVNKTCGAIHEEYKKLFPESIDYSPRGRGLSRYTRAGKKKAQDKQKFLLEKRALLREKINKTYYGTQVGFLMATEHFKKYVMDPSEDFVQNCIDNKEHMIIKPNVQKENYQAALVDARKKLLNSLSDLGNGENFLGISTTRAIDNDIDDYIKTDSSLILKSILQAKENEQEDLAKFLCYRAKEIYDEDEFVQKGMILTGGVVSFAGLILSPFGGGLLIPAGGGIMAAGAGIDGTKSLLEQARIERAVTRQTSGSATDYTDTTKRLEQDQQNAVINLVTGTLMGGVKIPMATTARPTVRPYVNRLPAPNRQQALPAPNNTPRLPAPSRQQGLPAPTNTPRLPAPSRQQALPAPTNTPRLPAPNRQQALPAPSNQRALAQSGNVPRLPAPQVENLTLQVRQQFSQRSGLQDLPSAQITDDVLAGTKEGIRSNSGSATGIGMAIAARQRARIILKNVLDIRGAMTPGIVKRKIDSMLKKLDPAKYSDPKMQQVARDETKRLLDLYNLAYP